MKVAIGPGRRREIFSIAQGPCLLDSPTATGGGAGNRHCGFGISEAQNEELNSLGVEAASVDRTEGVSRCRWII
jgi:hypothetical protein